MNVLTLILPIALEEQAHQLQDRLVRGLGRLQQEADGITVHVTRGEKQVIIQCTASQPDSPLYIKGSPLIKKIGEVMADFIMDMEEGRMIREIIRKEYSYIDSHEIAKIEHYCNQLLHPMEEMNADAGLRRKVKVSAALKKYLQEYSEMNWQGFVAFRLKEYREDLREVVEYAIDEFLMEKQYQEFISLLKYFVYIQEAKMPEVHLMHRGGHDFDLLNEQMSPIDTSQFDTFRIELIDQDINLEDMVVSALITVSPEVIHLHTREPELQVIKTIMNIFEGRARLCTSCKACQPLLSRGKTFSLDL
jgi:putative sporulation protein YtxC